MVLIHLLVSLCAITYICIACLASCTRYSLVLLLSILASLADFTGRLHWHLSLADFTGILHWHTSLAYFTGILHWQTSLAYFTGRLYWQTSLADFTGILHWQTSLAYFTDRLHWQTSMFRIITVQRNVNNNVYLVKEWNGLVFLCLESYFKSKLYFYIIQINVQLNVDI